jgi:hypothetical protein
MGRIERFAVARPIAHVPVWRGARNPGAESRASPATPIGFPRRVFGLQGRPLIPTVPSPGTGPQRGPTPSGGSFTMYADGPDGR